MFIGTNEVKILNYNKLEGTEKYETNGNAVLFLWKNGSWKIN